MVQRLLIIGPPGAGKSTLAQTLSVRIKVPAVHLDCLYWLEDWKRPDLEAWNRRHQEALCLPTWIIEGNYPESLVQQLDYAEAVVFLDTPLLVCLVRVFRRWFLHRGECRVDLAPGCPEQISVALLRYIWHFGRVDRVQILERLKCFTGPILVFKASWKTEELLKFLGAASELI